MTTRPWSTARRTCTHVDGLGVTIAPTDRVRVKSWGGGARLVDCGTVSDIVRINRSRIVIIDSDGYERSVSPSNLGVLRRDGSDGYEANKPASKRCTCGAHHITGCFCGLTPREFYAVVASIGEDPE